MKTKTSHLIAIAVLGVFLLPTAQAGTKFGLYIGDYDRSERHHHYRDHHARKDYHRGRDHKHYKRDHRSRGSKVIIISPRAHYRSGYDRGYRGYRGYRDHHGYRDFGGHGSYRGYRKHYWH